MKAINLILPILLINDVNIAAEEEVDIVKITNGVRFRKIENNMIVYEHALPIIYREPILTSENTIRN